MHQLQGPENLHAVSLALFIGMHLQNKLLIVTHIIYFYFFTVFQKKKEKVIVEEQIYILLLVLFLCAIRPVHLLKLYISPANNVFLLLQPIFQMTILHLFLNTINRSQVIAFVLILLKQCPASWHRKKAKLFIL